MVSRGVKEAHKERFDVGDALDWTRLSYSERKRSMERSVNDTLITMGGKVGDDGVVVEVGDKPVLIVPHGVPAAMSVAAAREMVGQPFLHDHKYATLLDALDADGPVHFIACHRNVTEAQAIKQLGFPDATIVTTSFGIYVADRVQKIQLVFLKNCRDQRCVQQSMQSAFEWFDESGEGEHFGRRASERRQIVETIASVQDPSNANDLQEETVTA